MDYIDPDVAYFLGLVIARGTIIPASESHGVNQIIIEFPYVNLTAEGITTSFDQQSAIRLALLDTRERLLELLDADISLVNRSGGVDFVIRFLRNNMIWRNILLLTGGKTNHYNFTIPEAILSPGLPTDIKREFVRGYADVGGNIRHANRYVDGKHRVRLDILNANWDLPVQLCLLIQEHLDVPVQLITWGHPNMGRGFREHQLNIFAEPFLKIGFSFQYKQRILEEFVEDDRRNFPHATYHSCPGRRRHIREKPADPEESSDRLDSRLRGKHFDAYWQICKALNCPREPTIRQPSYEEEIVEEA